MNAVLVASLLVLSIGAPPEDELFESENRTNLKGGPKSSTTKDDAPKAPAKKPAKRGAQTVKRVEVKEAFDAADAAEIRAKEGASAVVKGKVTSVFMPKSNALLVLNFSKDRAGFKVAIFSKSFDKWEGGADGIKRLVQGKVLAVDGIVTLYEGAPQIIVSVPSQLKVVE
ncbi:MAG: hypothetical protein ACRC1K_25475 [Planctomycetia bacterium]